MRSRAAGFAFAIALTVGGCSLLFNGNDLKGRNGDMGGGGTGGGDSDMGGAGGAGGGGTGGGGGTTSMCTPLTSVKFTVTHPSVAASTPRYLTVSDINKDGKLDLVTSNYDSNSFSVLLGDGSGGFALAASTPIGTCANPDEVVARDVNGDGLDDLIITCWTGSAAAVNVHVNQSTTSTVAFAAAKPVTLPASGHYFFPAPGTFDASGHVGLALVGNGGATFYAGDGAGNFTKGSTVNAGAGAQSAAVGKLNGDALDDLIVYNSDDTDMTMMLSGSSPYTATRIAYDATGATTGGTPGGTTYFGSTPILLDYDGDGLLDIVIASGTSVPGEIYFFKNGGTASAPMFGIQPTTMVAVGDIPSTLALADLNCDGKLDIASSSNGCTQNTQGCTNSMDQPPQLWVLDGHGTGFDPRQTTAIDAYCDTLAVADFNGDGYNDIACGSDGGTFNLLINTP